MKRILKLDKFILAVSAILLAGGTLMILSASNVYVLFRFNNQRFYSFFIKQSVYIAAGVIVALMAMVLNKKLLNHAIKFLLFIGFALLLWVLIAGPEIKGARSWTPQIKGVPFNTSFQPSEFVKIFYIAWAALFYHENKDKLKDPRVARIPLLIGGAYTLLIILQKDLGTAFIMMFIVAFMFVCNPVYFKYKIFMKLSLLLITVLLVVSTHLPFIDNIKHAKARRFDTHNPCSEEKFKTYGNNLCNSYIAINNGGLKGRGLNKSTQKYLYLPEGHTDYIFAIIVEELGFLGGLGLFVLYSFLLLRLIFIARNTSSSFGKNICYGAFIYFTVHIILNVGGITGFLPMTGVPLPFMSYGGSFILSIVALLGLIHRVTIDTKIKKLPPRKR